MNHRAVAENFANAKVRKAFLFLSKHTCRSRAVERGFQGVLLVPGPEF